MTRVVKQLAWSLEQSQLKSAEIIGADYKETTKKGRLREHEKEDVLNSKMLRPIKQSQ